MSTPWRPDAKTLTAIDLSSAFANGQATVVQFWAAWNAYDREFDNILAPLRDEFHEQIQFVAVDTCDCDLFAFCDECKVVNIPALAMFVGARRTKTIIGLRTLDVLRSEFETLLIECKSAR